MESFPNKCCVSDIVSSIRVPTLVIPCKDDTLIPIECGRFLAQNIPDAQFIELPGHDHLFFVHEQIGDYIEEAPHRIGLRGWLPKVLMG
jgi:pimeloyl-ACP methyl ester carboxylesterase